MHAKCLDADDDEFVGIDHDKEAGRALSWLEAGGRRLKA